MGRTDHVTFEADDGWRLTGTLYTPEEAPHTALLMSSGTGIPRRFYRRFAEFAASRGFAVLTYDYRGIGDSAPADLSTCTFVYRDWGQLDMPAAIDWMRRRWKDLPLVVVGHSGGGQQLGLARNVAEVRAALFVAVSTGYWRGMPFKQRWFTFGLWNALVPWTGRLVGYFPSRRLGLGEDLPAGIASEWGAWCLEPAYMAAFFDDGGHRACVDERPFGTTFFADVRCPVTAYCFTDDDIATPDNVPPMLGLLNNAEVTTHWFEPADLGLAEIGHLGFFRELGQPLWSDALQRLRSQAVG